MSSRTKPRAVSYHDGRIGFPGIVEYELIEGPGAGTRVPVPPNHATHPHPTPDRIMIRKPGFPRPVEIWPPLTRPGCAYLTVIHDPDAYEELKARGFWLSPEHAGRTIVIDNRRTAVA